MTWSSLDVHDEVVLGVDMGGGARPDDHGRLALLDDGRAFDLDARQQRVVVVDRGVDEAAESRRR